MPNPMSGTGPVPAIDCHSRADFARVWNRIMPAEGHGCPIELFSPAGPTRIGPAGDRGSRRAIPAAPAPVPEPPLSQGHVTPAGERLMDVPCLGASSAVYGALLPGIHRPGTGGLAELSCPLPPCSRRPAGVRWQLWPPRSAATASGSPPPTFSSPASTTGLWSVSRARQAAGPFPPCCGSASPGSSGERRPISPQQRRRPTRRSPPSIRNWHGMRSGTPSSFGPCWNRCDKGAARMAAPLYHIPAELPIPALALRRAGVWS